MKPAFVTFIVMIFVFFLLFLVLSEPLDIVFTAIKGASNETMTPAYLNNTHYIINGLGKIFGVVCVLATIGAVVAYFLDSHRSEYEEFQEYEKYGRL